jgi:RimJ/RimL family protein N-acetyltransferase
MLVPATTYKEEIEQEFKKIQYSEKYLWYTGSIDNYDMEVKTEGDKFAYAIALNGELIGYISFRVDWYCSMAYNFSLIKFKDKIADEAENEYWQGSGNTNLPIGGFYISTKPIMASAIREVMRMIESFKLHRIDFRCVSGNPAEFSYWRIMKLVEKSGKWHWHEIKFTDNIKDTHGNYHDTIVYELIRREKYEDSN